MSEKCKLHWTLPETKPEDQQICDWLHITEVLYVLARYNLLRACAKAKWWQTHMYATLSCKQKWQFSLFWSYLNIVTLCSKLRNSQIILEKVCEDVTVDNLSALKEMIGFHGNVIPKFVPIYIEMHIMCTSPLATSLRGPESIYLTRSHDHS